MKVSTALIAAAFASTAVAEDVLISKRLTKRCLDDDGHYNISEFGDGQMD